MHTVLRVGLTGGIGSGKSTIAALLATCGARIIDADAISRELTGTGGNAIHPIAQAFGRSFIDEDGALKREEMRSLVYSDAVARAKLESIVHPMVGNAIKIQTNSAIKNHCKVVVFDVPLLVESPIWRERVDHLLVVDSTPEVQIDRVVTRSGMTVTQVEQIIAAQASRQRRLRAADTIICNASISLSQLASEVHFIARRFGLSCP
jgi:dephospho-CoA kinase